MKMLVAYLDLLGFRDHLSDSVNDTLRSLSHYAEVFAIKSQEIGWTPQEQGLREPARAHSVDTFDYFLPFSDSIVIASSKEPNIFIRQIASFLCGAFTFNSKSFDPIPMQMEGRDNPLEEKESKLGRSADDHRPLSQEKYLNYPVLFRGGLSYGDVESLTMLSRVKGVSQSATLLAGQGVVDAVKLEESKIKGPRILFDQDVFDTLSKENQLGFCRKVPEELHSTYYELLWPNASCFDSNFSNPNYGEIVDLYGKAIALRDHYDHAECHMHYCKFSELILASAMAGAKVRKQHTELQEHLRELVKRYNFSEKYNDL